MKLPITLLAALAGVAPALAQTVYFNNFESPVGAEWSNTNTEQTPVGARNFLGRFSNNSVTLDLTGLPAHGQVSISFDLFVVGTWDGLNGSQGPDPWKISVGDFGSQPEVLATTFSTLPGPTQSYPDSIASGLSHPQRTGASESNTLGYVFGGVPNFWDSVYSLSFTVPHTATDFRAVFAGDPTLQGPGDEFWGIDNVTVTVSPVPEPGEYAAVFGLGLVGAAAWCRRARQQAGNVPVA